MTPQDEIKKILERAERVAEASSDDFGHNVTACMEWQVQQIDGIATDTSRLCKALLMALDGLKNSCVAVGCADGSCYGCSACEIYDEAIKELRGE